MRARTNWRSSQEVLNMVFDPDGNYYTDKIKPNSIDTLALSVGAKSMQFGLTNTVLHPNFDSNKNVVKVQGGVLTHYTISETARSWTLADNVTTLRNDTQAYYIYAKCSRTGNSGSIIFSPEQIKVEQDAMFYHFWIGVVNSVDSELHARSLALSYGFTMMNGRFIKAGRIESADRTTYFDLDNSEIGGTINFKDGLISGEIGIGNKDGINAGMSGEGSDPTSIRLWSGASKEKKDTAPFRVLQDGTINAYKGIFAGYLQTPFVKLRDSDAVWNDTRKVFCIKNNLNISSNGGTDKYHYNSDWIELPYDKKYIGTIITVVNTNFPPYVKLVWALAPTVLLVSQESKNKRIGIGGRYKRWSRDDSDPYAISILGRVIRLLCVERGDAGRRGLPHWLVLEWGNDIKEKEWE